MTRCPPAPPSPAPMLLHTRGEVWLLPPWAPQWPWASPPARCPSTACGGVHSPLSLPASALSLPPPCRPRAPHRSRCACACARAALAMHAREVCTSCCGGGAVCVDARFCGPERLLPPRGACRLSRGSAAGTQSCVGVLLCARVCVHVCVRTPVCAPARAWVRRLPACTLRAQCEPCVAGASVHMCPACTPRIRLWVCVCVCVPGVGGIDRRRGGRRRGGRHGDTAGQDP
jgi:hypothetical protein